MSTPLLSGIVFTVFSFYDEKAGDVNRLTHIFNSQFGTHISSMWTAHISIMVLSGKMLEELRDPSQSGKKAFEIQ